MSDYGYWKFGIKCGLKGAPNTEVALPDGRVLTQKDPNNPAVMSDADILHCLRRSRQARHDFERLFPTLDAESQERLTNLIQRNPRAAALVTCPQDAIDAIQKKNVTSGVRT